MLISIITPIYNAEKYLEECLQSILRQTWTDFELLLIDNNSNDRGLSASPLSTPMARMG